MIIPCIKSIFGKNLITGCGLGEDYGIGRINNQIIINYEILFYNYINYIDLIVNIVFEDKLRFIVNIVLY